VSENLIPKGVDLQKIDTPAERQARENFKKWLYQEMPSINSHRGVEYYSGEYYGDR